jgi:hypothetical protein
MLLVSVHDYLPTVNLPCRRWWGDDGGRVRGCVGRGVTVASGSGLAVAPRIELGFQGLVSSPMT